MAQNIQTINWNCLELPDGLGYMASRAVALEHVAGETLLVGMLGDETQILILARMEPAKCYILQREKIVVARRSRVDLLHRHKGKFKKKQSRHKPPHDIIRRSPSKV